MVYDFFEELKNIILNFFLNLYHKMKYAIFFILLIICMLGIFKFEKFDPDIANIESQQLYFRGISLDNWQKWITLVVIPFTGCWALFQFKKNQNAKKQEKAVQIAREFSNDLIYKCDIIYHVYKLSSLKDFLKFDEKDYEDFKYFNVEELRKIYDNDNFPTTFENLKRNSAKELDSVYHSLLKIYTSEYSNQKSPHVNITIKNQKVQIHGSSSNTEDNKKELDIFKYQYANFPYHFSDLESELLNQLEYICMDISSKATDSKYIYQSLHQMFLRTIRTLAADISISNKNFYNKYYTNIIHVYNSWSKKYNQDKKIEKKKKEKINKILNPKIKTV